MGSSAYPAFERDNPADWLATMTVPHEGLKTAIAFNEGKREDTVSDNHTLLKSPHSHLGIDALYATLGAESIGLEI